MGKIINIHIFRELIWGCNKEIYHRSDTALHYDNKHHHEEKKNPNDTVLTPLFIMINIVIILNRGMKMVISLTYYKKFSNESSNV